MTHRRWIIAALAAGLPLLAGCTSSGSSPTDQPVISPVSTPSVPSSVASSTAAPPSSPPASVSASSTPAPPATTTAHSAPPTRSRTTAPPVPERSTCTKIGIRVIPGGASIGQEIAALQFTNNGSTSCRLAGYPSVTLLAHGRPVGRPSQPSSTAASGRTLAAGAVAESLLHNYVGNCQAPISESIRVVAPGSTQSAVRPMQLRACVLRVDKLDAPN